MEYNIDNTIIAYDKDDIVITNEIWNPTPETFSAYQLREIELAKMNLRRSGIGNKDTIHSEQTVRAASKLLGPDTRSAKDLPQPETNYYKNNNYKSYNKRNY